MITYTDNHLLSDLDKMSTTDVKLYIHNVKRHLIDKMLELYPRDSYEHIRFIFTTPQGCVRDGLRQVVGNERDIDKAYRMLTIRAEVPNEQNN